MKTPLIMAGLLAVMLAAQAAVPEGFYPRGGVPDPLLSPDDVMFIIARQKTIYAPGPPFEVPHRMLGETRCTLIPLFQWYAATNRETRGPRPMQSWTRLQFHVEHISDGWVSGREMAVGIFPSRQLRPDSLWVSVRNLPGRPKVGDVVQCFAVLIPDSDRKYDHGVVTTPPARP